MKNEQYEEQYAALVTTSRKMEYLSEQLDTFKEMLLELSFDVRDLEDDLKQS